MQMFEPGELRRRIDEVLFYVWDPIGVSPNPDARREYSSYVGRVSELLEKESDAAKIVKYLCEIESGMMGLPADEGKAQTVVELLQAHKDAILQGRA